MTSARARELLAKVKGCRVLLLGDLMLDEWVFGSVKRISPEAPIPVVNMPLTAEARSYKPGGAGNVAAILLGLGAAVNVIGVVGKDELGERLVDDLKTRGAEVSNVLTDPSRPTTHKLRIIAGRQQLLRIDTESAIALSSSIAEEIRNRLQTNIVQADVMLVSDYAKGVISSQSLPPTVITSARSNKIPVCIDPKPVNIEVFRGATLISPNETEACEAAGVDNNNANDLSGSLPSMVLNAGQLLREQLEVDSVFITRGEAGIAVFSSEGAIGVPASRVAGSVGDGTGCGDAVSAVSALALAVSASYLEAAELANAAGGVVSRFVGVHNPSADEIVNWLEH